MMDPCEGKCGVLGRRPTRWGEGLRVEVTDLVLLLPEAAAPAALAAAEDNAAEEDRNDHDRERKVEVVLAAAAAAKNIESRWRGGRGMECHGYIVSNTRKKNQKKNRNMIDRRASSGPRNTEDHQHWMHGVACWGCI